MAWKNPIVNLAALSLGLSQLAIAVGFPVLARASSTPSDPNSNVGNPWLLSQFNPPDRGAPDVAVGGATRGDELCNITPLIPKDTSRDYGDIDPPYFGLTVTERPTFFWHVEKSYGQEITFEVYEYNTEGRGKDGQLVYETNFNVPETPGVVSIKLPPTAGLEIGKTYRWYFDIICGGGNAVEVVSIPGWVERVDATPILSSQLVRAETIEARSQAYAQSGVWFDALNILGQERITADTDLLKTEWENLLKAIDLENAEGVANAPFMDCCNESVELFGEEPALTSQN